MSAYSQVVEFNRDILGISERSLGMQTEDEFALSIHQLREEVDEALNAYKQSDFIGLIDALCDLEYFLFGVMYKNGLTEELHDKIFTAIHVANMNKKLGVKQSRQGYGNSADAVKPANWVAPEVAIARILEQA